MFQGRVAAFRVVHVFDVTQTEGEDLTEFAQVQGEPEEKLIRIEEIIRSRGIELEYAESLPMGARGMSAGGKVSILSTLPKAEMFSTLVHELAHELLHILKVTVHRCKSHKSYVVNSA